MTVPFDADNALSIEMSLDERRRNDRELWWEDFRMLQPFFDNGSDPQRDFLVPRRDTKEDFAIVEEVLPIVADCRIDGLPIDGTDYFCEGLSIGSP
ncbi:hypothetical protein BSZ21_17585 [Bradyrhizobium canariense]|uniref:hypothetical protein n=1 Tax=Bradyrhizobium canariense TaxID=255045 RepID=UPI000A18BBB9|nr:hypothetical protein [Bradyrhizobium canariense]OSI67404.1 hypothetical protein BSZ21_17585 [Bradyrhizobium canariense]